jgi:parallel beta-helix repeat protein
MQPLLDLRRLAAGLTTLLPLACAPSSEASDEEAHSLALQAVPCTGVAVSPGANLQGLINASPAGTTFCFASGTYPIATSLSPKAGDKFVAVFPRTAVFTGNGTTAVFMRNELVDGVELRGLVVEHFPTPRQGGMAAIKGGNAWVFDNNEFRWNDVVLYHGSYAKVTNNYFHHNWHMGSGFKVTNVLVEGNEVAYQNPTNEQQAPVLADGVSKWGMNRDLTIRNNWFHHNNGTGIWLDNDNINFVVENNRSENNTNHGIFYEISCAGVVRNNSFLGNGGSGINVSDSQNADIHNNYLRGNKYGIRVWHLNRISEQDFVNKTWNCPHTLKNVQIHDNIVQQDVNYTGLLLYGNTDGTTIYGPADGRVRFFANTYYNNVAKPFYWWSALRTRQEWQSYGQDVGGTFLTGSAPPPGSTTPTSSPYGGIAATVPGTIQAENFDEGGAGVAYLDTTLGNSGGTYRNTDVDVGVSSDAGGSAIVVGWIGTNEWLKYTVNVAASEAIPWAFAWRRRTPASRYGWR